MKRIYKDRSQRKISGVCAGLAEYLGLDVTLVRVAWAVISLLYGIGIVAYLVCAVIFPDKSEIE
ncbi:MAG: PspC domain-containing protein [Clostridiaceae bacterium]|nr:PspC domain-containing protein [Clostridiaceae bacterium]